MKPINKFLLIPSLIPLILIFSISLINSKPKIQIRLLLWESKELSLGAYLALTTMTGFTIGTLPSILARNNTPRKRRKVVFNSKQAFRNSIQEDEHYDFDEDYNNLNHGDYVERDVREPSPTISVPYKVISKSNQQKIKISQSHSKSSNQNIYEEEIDLTVDKNKIISEENQSSDWLDNLDDKW